jgi:hypothetical protein
VATERTQTSKLNHNSARKSNIPIDLKNLFLLFNKIQKYQYEDNSVEIDFDNIKNDDNEDENDDEDDEDDDSDPEREIDLDNIEEDFIEDQHIYGVLFDLFIQLLIM